ncbi:pyrroloquinoline quinone biosynthesis protein PqqB [Oharaeibacter diazotrophicus]|uniref:Coenzyme PQQ synthesis protein B n=1 Tax=Oharaeibacter diazotrophicus TaxID=1920512 RepID=A0A4R6RME2_9HYPH|nr:pyrroloquinoline quinone biosynthesis protein PqqB [Oharaeibacter diazotrophicus]TDP87734.1 pyrroloquinoline quinone biosynthesis protein B [Oharaeibacter diazotrophicus]BBE74683.1 coenzyme PQQ synthesis protein B [Pleomorphomonas sp. SM30]GLS77064.1 coenzyme PQQ synthesis protein B [Oharaeibacter diazotrophicus]
MRDRPGAATRLRALILGAAAGGGFPQWNCNCPNCAGLRRGEPGLEARTQASLAVTVDGKRWALLNAAPEITQQIAANPALHPRDPAVVGGRHSPIATVLVTNADIDAIAGLLGLREKQAFRLVGTAETLGVIDANPIFRGLDRDLVRFERIALGDTFELVPGATARLFPVPGKIPLFLEGERVVTDLEGEQTVGVEIVGPAGERLAYVPGCARMTPAVADRLAGADVVFFDGTVFTDDEMIRLGVGTKTGKRMGHMAMSGPDGTLEAFRTIPVKRRIFVHVNNTNPALREGSPERRAVADAGWEIGRDGMEVPL